MRLILRAPPGFSFRRTVLSHGWCLLAPFSVDAAGDRLDGVLALPRGGAVTYCLRPSGARIVLEAPANPDPATRRLLREAVRRILNLDLELSSFYDLASGIDRLGWIPAAGAGRMMRGASVWEDLTKLVLTTNCSWASTTRMIRSLVDLYGEPAPNGLRAFPAPEAIARAGARALRDQVRVGYRAPLLARLARDVADGRIDPEAWERDPRDPGELRREMLGLPGVGPYVAENLLKLLGRPDGLALDSWLRAKYARVYHGGRPVSDRTIARRYARLGRWGGLALWCEMTRDWFAGEEPSGAWQTLD